MRELDHSLIFHARKLITGANVHAMRTAIFCYETSPPHSKQREIYERGLREIVRTHMATSMALQNAKAACRHASELRRRSDALAEKVRGVLAAHATEKRYL